VAVSGNTTRSEAIKKAKSGSGGHVAWIRIDIDRMTAGSNASIQDVFIEYVLYAPETAKVVGTGRTYPSQRNRSVIPSPRNGGIYGDSMYVQAGREAAEKILAALSLPTRPVIVR
jgi:hypothetical protein